MIELGEEAEYEVEVVAVIGVQRTIRVTARGDRHAREVAKDLAGQDLGDQVWTFMPSGETVRVPRENITQFITGMCPKKL